MNPKVMPHSLAVPDQGGPNESRPAPKSGPTRGSRQGWEPERAHQANARTCDHRLHVSVSLPLGVLFLFSPERNRDRGQTCCKGCPETIQPRDTKKTALMAGYSPGRPCSLTFKVNSLVSSRHI